MQTGQAAGGPLQTESTAGVRSDVAEIWGSPDPRVFGEGKMLLPLLMVMLRLLLSAAGCSGSL